MKREALRCDKDILVRKKNANKIIQLNLNNVYVLQKEMKQN